ncbi:error-prone DNA polymerase [Methylovirgula sp. HY1]|uniref:error-prone DNA polymerase n=1 Tax=Methylovirgula sp. HY1 TaxID=2822761 RepID=UPI001C78137D|nr:error-prone DNA polymerase [Methylovirgula sp. HY1]QXX73468.1 Error-prone DNA polymerase [Methylovirgula sp. HY1]
MKAARSGIAFAELAVTTNFSFLRGASHPEELVAHALDLGLAGIGIADRNSLAGVVRAHVYARDNEAAVHGLKLAIGARLVFCDGTPDILAFPRDRTAYSRLTRLITCGNLRAQKGFCLLTRDDLLVNAAGMQLIVMPASTWEEEDTHKRVARTYEEFISPQIPHTEELAKLSARVPQASRSARDLASSFETPLSAAPQDEGKRFLLALKEATQNRVWLAAAMTYGRAMRQHLAERVALSRATSLPLIATNDVLMHAAARRPLQDVLTAIRKNASLDSIGRRLEANAERHLKNGTEMARLFAEAPDAIGETLRFLDGLSFSLDELAHEYPEELREGFASSQEALEAFAHEGAARRYPDGVPERVKQALLHELKLVAALAYAPYFLTVHDIVRFARGQGILCQGRGSAANSVLCFCLGITEVDPAIHDLLFERFISAERKEPPDIDVDFEHERREEVMQYIYARYGRARAGLTASVITYRSRSAMRDVGKVFGLSEDVVAALSGDIWGRSSDIVSDDALRRIGLDPAEPRLKKALALAGELIGFPRHLSQHTGGFVITRGRLDETVPIANAAMDARTTVEWDKDDLDALGILKVDVLALGMLTCLRKGFALLESHYGKSYTLASLPAEEPAVYAMISRADTIGVFQIESRAQMSMLPRLRPKAFYDLVIEVAIVRPGPIQGDMVHPYLRRRQGQEPINYPSKELQAVLGKTLGIPLFQEQAMKIAIVAAGFTPAEADKLRRAMATFKRTGMIGKFRDKMTEGMVARNYTRDFAARCFRQIEGFGTYGFPESHAASFALLVYASAWMKCRYPDVFACALLNAQPMGFYAPAQILRDAREHGIAIEEVDVNFSEWDSTLSQRERVAAEQLGEGSQSDVPKTVTPHPPPLAAPSPSGRGVHPRHSTMAGEILSTHKIRLGFRQVKGLSQKDIDELVAKRGKGYDSIRDLWLRTGVSPGVLAALADADAFRSIGLDRRDALWAVRGLNRAGDKDDLPLLKALSFCASEPDAHLPPMPLGEHVVEDYRHLSLSLKAHPLSFLRDRLAAKAILRTEDLAKVPSGQRVTTAGLVLVRQRPGSAKGVIFLTMEDETGVANAIIWPKVFESLRPIVIGARFIAVTGRLQAEAGVIHIIAERAEDLTPLLGLLTSQNKEIAQEISGLARADAVKRPHHGPRFPLSAKKQRGGEAGKSAEPELFDRGAAADLAADLAADFAHVLPKGRNFH